MFCVTCFGNNVKLFFFWDYYVYFTWNLFAYI